MTGSGLVKPSGQAAGGVQHAHLFDLAMPASRQLQGQAAAAAAAAVSDGPAGGPAAGDSDGPR